MYEATARCTHVHEGEECGYEVTVTAPEEFTARDGAEHLLYHYHQDNVMHRRGDDTEISVTEAD